MSKSESRPTGDRNKGGVRKSPAYRLRKERLQTHLVGLEQILDFRKDIASAASREPWASYAKKNLESAKSELNNDDLEKAWAHTNQGARFLYQSMDATELKKRARVLRREAEEKLKNWRKDAVLDVLGRDVDSDRDFKPDDLMLAQLLLDTHFDNLYFKLQSLADRVTTLSITLGAFAVLVLAASFALDYCEVAGTSFLFSITKTALIALLGASGAMLTYALSSLGTGIRIPEMLRQIPGQIIRPAVGALSAVAVCLIVESGILPFEAPDDRTLYAWAVLAGLSERILNGMVRSAERSAQA